MPWVVALTLHAQEEPPYKLVLLADFTNASKSANQALALGIQLGIEEVNFVQGVLGRKLKLIHHDHHGSPSRALELLKQNPLEADQLALFGGAHSHVVDEVARHLLAEEQPFPYLLTLATSTRLTQYPFVYRLGARDDLLVKFMLQKISQWQAKKVAILVERTLLGHSVIEAFKHQVLAMQQQGQSLQLLVQWHNWKESPQSTRFRLHRLLNKHPDGLILAVQTDVAQRVLEAFQALPAEQQLPMLAHPMVNYGDLLLALPSGWELLRFNLMQTFSFEHHPSRPKNHYLRKIAGIFYHEQFNSMEDFIHMDAMAQGYDMVHILAQAVQQAKSSKPQDVLKALNELKPYHGLIDSWEQPFQQPPRELLSLKHYHWCAFQLRDHSQRYFLDCPLLSNQ